MKHYHELAAALQERFQARKRGEWMALLDSTDVPFSPVNTVADALADPQVEALGTLARMVHPSEGEVDGHRLPGAGGRRAAAARDARAAADRRAHGRDSGRARRSAENQERCHTKRRPEHDRRESARPKVRRIVTGHDRNNKAKVIIDSWADNVKSSAPTSASIAVWASDTMPIEMPVGEAGEVEDCGQRKLPTQPPPNGTRFIVMEFEPGAEGQMHRTETIDYISCLEGEIEMDMDDSKVTCAPAT